MLEKDIESYLREEVKKLGGTAYKWAVERYSGHRGVPDRIVLLPKGRVFFVELKATGKKPGPLQLKVHRDMTAMGHIVLVIDSKQGVDDFLRSLDS